MGNACLRMAIPDNSLILVLSCPDTKGIVAEVAGFLAARDASITEANHFNDSLNNRFYMRTVFRAFGSAMPDAESLRAEFAPIAKTFDMDWALYDTNVRPRLIIAVSKFGHCLFDLLHRWRSGSLPVAIAAVVSNHEDMRSFVEWNGLPYYFLGDDKASQERDIMRLMDEEHVDLLVLARYMQVLSPELCAKLTGRCINIHHSFLPGFKGAKPYQQAYARGVKIIGATAHYVTASLDDGPIIEQDVQRVSHAHTPADLVDVGRDIECRVLAHAVTWHIERRIIVADDKTIVFT